MKKLVVIVLSVLFVIMFPGAVTHADFTHHALTFRAIVEKGGVVYEYTYNNPDEFKVEKGNRVIRGKTAEKEVRDFYAALHFSKDANIEGMVASLKKSGYSSFENLQIRYIDENEKLYTWVWPQS